MKITHYAFKLFLALTICFSCSNSDPGITQPPEEEPITPSDTTELEDKEACNIKGYVKCGETGIPNVAVSDGVTVTKTDIKGRYWLKSDSNRSEYVFISIPSNYEVPTKNHLLPQFYQRINNNDGKTVEQHDFTLIKRNNMNHAMFVVADIHISGRITYNGETKKYRDIDSVCFKKDFLPIFQQTVHNTSIPTYCISLGDQVQDKYWKTNNTSFPEYLSVVQPMNVPTFHVIGNHDHDPDVCNIASDDTEYLAGAVYRKYLGPENYSFNIGKVHYIMLDDVYYVNTKSDSDTDGNKEYQPKLTNAIWNWLEQDIKAISSSITHIVIGLHIPTNRTNPIASMSYCLQDRERLYNLCNGYITTILSGHNHLSEVVNIRPNVTEYIHTAICGNWWYEEFGKDGAPASFYKYEFNGDTMERSTYDYTNNTAYGYSTGDKPFRIYNKKITDLNGDPAILLNYWDWDNTCTIRVTENGKSVKEIHQINPSSDSYYAPAYDPLYKNLWDRKVISQNVPSVTPYKTHHMFIYTPQDKTAAIKITIVDRFKREWTINTSIQ